MKTIEFFWEHPLLKEMLRSCHRGAFLFRQGDEGNIMYIIQKGIVELIAHRNGATSITGLVEAGQFLGEKAILSPTAHQRVFSARAKSDLVVCELTLDRIALIKEKAPELMTDILRQMFQIAAERLDRSNQLVNLLRSSDNFTRLVELIVHFSRTWGSPTPSGVEVILHPDSLGYYIDLPASEISKILERLCEKKVLRSEGDDLYLIVSESDLAKAPTWLKVPKLRAA